MDRGHDGRASGVEHETGERRGILRRRRRRHEHRRQQNLVKHVKTVIESENLVR
jgi:hypothetical protein